MAAPTLETIRTKVRRLTRSMSESQLSTVLLDEYINTFILYDFPEHLRLFDLKTTFTFYSEPFIDVYETETSDTTSPFYNFKNRYITLNPPLFIAGYQSLYSQSREQFFGIYPLVNSIQSIGVAGDGVTTVFSGTLSNAPLLQNNVLFSSINTAGEGLALIDYPVSSTTGALGLVGAPQVLPSPYGSIDYITGAFALNFPTAPASGVPINSQTVPYVPSIPQAMLFYDNKITLRPVPDQPYKIVIEAFIRPTELLESASAPELEQWWQFIAYGAAIKVLQDRMDLESVALVIPEYKNQERLVLRKTIVQYTNDRAATIYTEQNAGMYGSGYFIGGGSF